MLAKELKVKLANGELNLGMVILYNCWSGYLEIMKRSGYDVAWLDCEHSAFTLQQVDQMCRVARLLELPLIIRAETTSYHLIRRYIDAGPSGIIIPYVERIEQIDILKQASYLPPRGMRSPGGQSVSWIGDPDLANWNEFEKHFFRMIQIESAAGIKSLPILLEKGDFIDAVMVGPYDLSISLGCLGMSNDSSVVSEAIEEIGNICRKHNKPFGMFAGTPEQARFWIERGCNLIFCGAIISVLAPALKSMNTAIRSIKQTNRASGI